MLQKEIKKLSNVDLVGQLDTPDKMRNFIEGFN